MKAHSVKYKTLVACLLVILTITGVFQYLSLQRSIDQRLGYLIISNEILVENQAKAAVLPMWNIDYVAVGEILEALSQTPDFVEATFYDDKGYEIVSSSKNTKSGRDNLHKISRDIQYQYRDENLYLGRLDVMVSLSKANEIALEEYRWSIIALIVMVAMLTMMIMTVLHVLITRPLSGLVKTFSDISRGNYDIHIPFESRKDEIGDLVRAAGIFQKKSIEFITLERQRKEKAQFANQAKNTFLMRMSHELRTPLNGILGYADMLEGEVRRSGEEHVSIIRKLGRRMLSQVDDLLDYSGIENDKIRIVVEPVKWVEVVESVIEDANVLAQENSNELMFISDPEIPEELNIDEKRIEQVLRHLVRNGLKFTQNGCVAINVKKIKQNQHVYTIRFSVEDNGIGIEREFQQRMFESFSQEDESVTRRFGGIGMGLAISSGILKLMGSQIQVDSEKSEGSKFFFDLEVTGLNTNEKVLSALSQTSMPVWVWDVSSDWRDRLMDQFFRLGLDSRGFDDLQILRRQLKSLSSSQKVVVIAHPRYSIDKTINHLIDIANDPRCELILVSDNKTIKKESLPASTMFMKKPFSIYRLHEYIDKMHVVNETAAAALVLGDVKDDVKTKQRLHVLVVEDDLVNQKLAKTMLEKMGYFVDVAENGKIAVEMFAKKNFDLILMDMMMPVMDGLQATRAIRRFKGEKSDIPIIAVTANAYEADKDDCIDAGMNGFVSKPYGIERLRKEIESVLNID